MLTVPEAARRTGRNPETIRRWIRDGRLPSHKVGTQHLVDEAELEALTSRDTLPPPPGYWHRTHTGEPMPDFVAEIRRQREAH